MAESETYLKTQQVADALGVSVSTIKRWVDARRDRGDPDDGQASAGAPLQRPEVRPPRAVPGRDVLLAIVRAASARGPRSTSRGDRDPCSARLKAGRKAGDGAG